MDKNKLTKEFIYKCEKQRKKNEKKLKPLTQDDIMKYEIADDALDRLLVRFGFFGASAMLTVISPAKESVSVTVISVSILLSPS